MTDAPDLEPAEETGQSPVGAVSHMIAEWKPIAKYNRAYCPLVVVLDWFTYVADQTKALHPVRYVASLNGETGTWVDDDGQELDIDPTHFYPLPSLPLPAIHNPPPVSCGLVSPSAADCTNMKEYGGGMDGERYHCDVCNKGYFLDYEDMK
jgi:hypothetical protein